MNSSPFNTHVRIQKQIPMYQSNNINPKGDSSVGAQVKVNPK